MIRDPLYREILERLNGELHEEAFERCAQDLLRDIYPTLVPIRGGRDGGMDGVTADAGDQQLVLIATAGDRVKRNLESSLNSILGNDNLCRRVIIATSRKMSPEKQQDLRDTAKTLGFQLVQIHEQAAMADLLYASPKWCKELLDITGEPPPLSIIARSCRPIITEGLIGRKDDAAWLTQTPGDRLLVGQPGSGKTFVLSTLARENGWLFVTTQDPGRIADGIRSQDPSALLLDDAHDNLDLLIGLSHLRKEILASVPIIATCWPGAKDDVIQSLNLTRDQVRELGPLTRPEIVQILESAGFRGSDSLIYQILNQADGRAGLAVTLAHLCMQGGDRDIKDVVFGEVLLRSIRATFESSVGPLAIDVLAALAVGGSSGMNLQVVSEYLRKSVADVRHAATTLSVGGVIDELDGKYLRVRPPELRYALMRKVFFRGALSLDIVPLVCAAPSTAATAETLVDSCHFGAAVPTDLLYDLVQRSGSLKVWESYAWLGRDESQRMLNKQPELIASLAHPGLHWLPEIAIPLLLREAIGDGRALHSHPNHPLRLIEDWVSGGLPGSVEPIKRRKALLDAVKIWIESGKDAQTGLHALSIVFDPSFRSHTSDPVLGRNVTLRWGLLTPKEIDEVAQLWDRCVDVLASSDSQEWTQIMNVVSDWVYPQRHSNAALSSATYNPMREIAAKMLRDIVRIGHSRAGVMHRASELAAELEIDLDSKPDLEFETLFPRIPKHSDESAQQARAIEELAQQWMNEEPGKIVKRIVQLEEEAHSVDERNRQTPWLANKLANHVSNPLDWISAILAVGPIGGPRCPVSCNSGLGRRFRMGRCRPPVP